MRAVRLYVQEKKSILEVAAAIGQNYSATRKLLIASKVRIRSRVEAGALAGPKISRNSIGKPKPCTEAARQAIRIAARLHGERFAVGVSLKPNGYLEITRGPQKGRSVHVVAAERALGRRLRPNECVHHIDRCRTNNDPTNLIVMMRSEHARFHQLHPTKPIRRNKDGTFS